MEISSSLAIVIVAYKNEEMTIKFVREQISKVITPHKIVIVNNGATIESNEKYVEGLSAELINESDTFNKVKDAPIYIINNTENSGFAKGNNIGAKFASKYFGSKYFLFTNNDIVLKDVDVVEKLIEKLELHPEVGIIGPMVRGLNGDYQSPEPYVPFADRYIWMYLSTPFMSKEKKIAHFNLDYSEKAKEGYHYRIMGSFFIVRAQDYFECGMMDEHTFLFAEEMILSERMSAIGKKVYYAPDSCVIHAHGATIKKNMQKRKMSNLQFNSNAYYYHHYREVSNIEIAIGRLVKNLIYLFKS